MERQRDRERESGESKRENPKFILPVDSDEKVKVTQLMHMVQLRRIKTSVYITEQEGERDRQREREREMHMRELERERETLVYVVQGIDEGVTQLMRIALSLLGRHETSSHRKARERDRDRERKRKIEIERERERETQVHVARGL